MQLMLSCCEGHIDLSVICVVVVGHIISEYQLTQRKHVQVEQKGS